MLFGLVAVCGPAQAQQSSAFVAYAEPLRFAAATELLELRLQALTAVPDGLEAEEAEEGEANGGEEEEEGPPIPLLALFAGSLAAADGDLLQAIEADLNTVHSHAEAGDRAALEKAVKQAREDLARARTVLVPADVRADPALQAALIAKLAVSERSFGEGYEEAAGGEVSAYPLAWLTLQRAQALWTQLKPQLDAPADGAERAFDEISALMPTLQPPAHFSDPEDVEGAALDLVFALEGALGRPVLVRGFAPALELMQQQAGAACDAVHDGHGRLALEQALAARITYSAHVAPTLATLAPDAHEDLSSLWGKLDTLRAADDAGAAKTCEALEQAVTQAKAVFG